MIAGQIVPLAVAQINDCFLPCDGAAYAQTDFPQLFNVIGNTFNTFRGALAPAAGFFRVPDYRGLALIGGGGPSVNPATSDRSAINSGGEETHTLALPESPTHSHAVNDPGHPHGNLGALALGGFAGSGTKIPGDWGSGLPDDLFIVPSFTGITIGDAGGSLAHNNLPPFAVVFWYIYAGCF